MKPGRAGNFPHVGVALRKECAWIETEASVHHTSPPVSVQPLSSRFWRRTKSAELASVIMEDTLALIGLAFAGAGIGLAILFDNEIFDAFGGLMVGLVLIAGSLLLMFKSGSLLIGEAVDSDTRKKIEQAVISTPGVERLLNMQTVHMSEDDILLCVKVQTSKLDRDYDVETVNKIERSVRTALPWFRFEIYVEPDLYRADHKIVS